MLVPSNILLHENSSFFLSFFFSVEQRSSCVCNLLLNDLSVCCNGLYPQHPDWKYLLLQQGLQEDFYDLAEKILFLRLAVFHWP